MKINFEEIEEKSLPNFKGGEKSMEARMYVDEKHKIMRGTLQKGATIGLHTHDTSSEIIYILSGKGTMIYDDTEETLLPGECHYCPKGHSHSLQNHQNEPLVFFAVVPEFDA